MLNDRLGDSGINSNVDDKRIKRIDMKEINQKLDQWIYNSIIRDEVREVIVKEIDKAYERGLEAGLDYKQNTNKSG